MENSQKKNAPYIYLASGMLFTGAHVVAGKVVGALFPLFFASGLTLIASSCLFFTYFLLKRQGIPIPDKKNLLLIVLQAFTGIFIFRIGILKGLSYTGAVEGGIILSSTPILIALLAFLFLHERFHPRILLAIFLSAAGILIINLLEPVGHREDTIFRGTLFLSAAVLGEALFTILRKKIGERVPATVNAAYTSLTGALFFLPLMIRDIRHLNGTGFLTEDWMLLFFYGTAAPMASFILWFTGVSRSSAAMAGIFTALLPLVTVSLSALFLHEPVRIYHIIGAVCVVGGILLSLTRPRRRKKSPNSG